MSLLIAVGMLAAIVVVQPGNMDGWFLQTTGGGAAVFQAGPGTPPAGTGSLHLTVGANGNDIARIRNVDYQGVKLSELTKLTYSTYVVNNFNCQDTYITLSLDLNGDGIFDPNGNLGPPDDAIFFEPCYQTGGYGMVSEPPVPDQCPASDVECFNENVWNSWDALVGGWWSNLDGFGGPPLRTIAGYIAAYGDAKIINSSSCLGGVRLATGAGAPIWDNFDGSVDDFTIGVNGSDTSYDFEPGIGPIPSCDPNCGNFTLDGGEQCDPPGSITCPPGSPLGAFLPCNADCTCGTTTTTVATPTTTTTTVPDHYVCYNSSTTEPKPPDVTVDDQFETAQFHPKRCHPKSFCVPASKNGSPIGDPVTHLKGYKIRRTVAAPEPRVTVDVTNQFGTIRLTTKKADRLLVPSAKSLVAPPPPPDPQGTGNQHYKCYKIRLAGGSFTPVTVTAADQFGTRQLELKKPVALCNPASKNGSVVKDSARHLLCYSLRPATKPPSPVFVTNQFGSQTVKLTREGAFCVPSTKQIVGASTTTTTTSSTTTTTLQQFCCDVPPGALGNPVPVCLDAVTPDVQTKCALLGGTLAPVGFVCDPDLEQCVPSPPVPPSNFCCECPLPSPPFPHPQVCFEGITGHEFKCQPPCVLHPALTCGPISETCGGS